MSKQLTRAQLSYLNIHDKCKHYNYRDDLMSQECLTSFYCTKDEALSRNKLGNIINDIQSRPSHYHKGAQ